MYDEEEKPKSGLYIGIGVTVLLLGIAVWWQFMRDDPPMKAPTALVPFTASDKSFACIGPDGWEKKYGGIEGGMAGFVTYTKNKAKIDVSSDLQGSLMGDIMITPSPSYDGMTPEQISQMPKPVPPVEKLHKMEAEKFGKKYKDFADLQLVEIPSKLGDARISQWTGTKEKFPKPTELHGYRVTILGNERRVSITCQCPEGDWKTMQPVFQKVIASVAPAETR